MHPALLHAYDDQLPVLRAGEQLAMATAVALGSGTLKRDAAQRLWSALTRQAQAGRPSRRVHVRDLAGVGRAMGGLGMGVRLRPPGGPGAPGVGAGTPSPPKGATGPARAPSDGM